jgi:hypothetical protein
VSAHDWNQKRRKRRKMSRMNAAAYDDLLPLQLASTQCMQHVRAQIPTLARE